MESRYRPTRTTQENEETEARTFKLKVFNGTIRAAIIAIWGQGQSGVLFPGDADTKTRQPVMEVMRYEYPAIRIPDLKKPECSSFKEYNQDPNIVLLDISEEDVE